jgi:hypothetical protein
MCSLYCGKSTSAGQSMCTWLRSSLILLDGCTYVTCVEILRRAHNAVRSTRSSHTMDLRKSPSVIKRKRCRGTPTQVKPKARRRAADPVLLYAGAPWAKKNVIQNGALELEVACAMNFILGCAAVPFAGEAMKHKSNCTASASRRVNCRSVCLRRIGMGTPNSANHVANGPQIA